MGKLTWGQRASAIFLLCATTAIGLPAQTAPVGSLNTLVNFTGTSGANLGADSFAGLAQDTSGNFYGTTRTGGTANVGTIYKITQPTITGGKLTTLYNFCTKAFCGDGGLPSYGALIRGSDGAFYGTTTIGGYIGSYGTVFKISETSPGVWTRQTIHQFTVGDGTNPGFASLVQGTDGNFYGTTYLGGTHGLGTVFEIDPIGSSLIVLHNFAGGASNTPDGAHPWAGLVQAGGLNFYGTTVYGGSPTPCHGDTGCGTIFEIEKTPSGPLFTTLWNFMLGHGENPYQGLVQFGGPQGFGATFYGTTAFGGASGDGTVYSVSVK